MNGPKYVELLNEKLKLHILGFMIFMQDGAPCRQSEVATEFLKEHKISVLECPGNSPDLNPVENLGTVVIDKMANKQPPSAGSLKSPWGTEITLGY